MDKGARNRFLMIHGGLLGFAVLFPLYQKVASKVSSLFVGCFFHDRLFLYCPLCGGTRAVRELLRLQLGKAFSYNPVVVLGILVFLVLDVIALVRLLRGKSKLYRIPTWGWIVAVTILVTYGILRNYLMIRWGNDPTGDLVRFWWK